MLNPIVPRADEQEDIQTLTAIAGMIHIDIHNQTDVQLEKAELPGPQLDTRGESLGRKTNSIAV